MKKFVFIYHGTFITKETSKEEMKSTMDKWTAWFDTFKDQMVDGGNPFAAGAQSVTANDIATVPADESATGYTIINANDIDEATKIAKRCPAVEIGGAVRVYEALPM